MSNGQPTHRVLVRLRRQSEQPDDSSRLTRLTRLTSTSTCTPNSQSSNGQPHTPHATTHHTRRVSRVSHMHVLRRTRRHYMLLVHDMLQQTNTRQHSATHLMPINFGTTPDAKELNFKPTTSGRVSDTTWYLLFEHVALWSSY